jgi:hypothetical protein
VDNEFQSCNQAGIWEEGRVFVTGGSWLDLHPTYYHSDKFTMRGNNTVVYFDDFTIDSAKRGLEIIGAAQVHMVNSTISDNSVTGIRVSGTGRLFMEDTIIDDNGGTSSAALMYGGIYVEGLGGADLGGGGYTIDGQEISSTGGNQFLGKNRQARRCPSSRDDCHNADTPGCGTCITNGLAGGGAYYADINNASIFEIKAQSNWWGANEDPCQAEDCGANISGDIGTGDVIIENTGNVDWDPILPSAPVPGETQCNDEIDNDGDGSIDHPDDDGCISSNDDSEARCGDNYLDPGEVCDGTALSGLSCSTLRPPLGQGWDTGDLACVVTCDAYDTSDCDFLTIPGMMGVSVKGIEVDMKKE